MPTNRRLEQALSCDSFESVLTDPIPAIDWPCELAGFRGTLDQVGLHSLLCVLEMEGTTGILVLIVEPEQEKAELHLSEGRVFRAHLVNREEPRNAELVYLLLACTRGSFDFRPSDVVLDDEMHCPTTRLILEGARRIDEARLDPLSEQANIGTGAPSGRALLP